MLAYHCGSILILSSFKKLRRPSSLGLKISLARGESWVKMYLKGNAEKLFFKMKNIKSHTWRRLHPCHQQALYQTVQWASTN